MRLIRSLLASAVLLGSMLLVPAVAQQIQPHGSPPPSSPSGPGSQPGPGSQSGGPASLQQGPSQTTQYWGAIGFTADGSYSTTWKQPTKADAEAKVLKECARFGRGACEVASGPGHLCIALATYRGGRWRLSFTAGGTTNPEAQQTAMNRCNDDKRVRSRRGCQLRISICGDGR